jgi:aspartyl-tRNA(Asn)/glutamyl-tRNA(Gln) amidotransferase subunit C
MSARSPGSRDSHCRTTSSKNLTGQLESILHYIDKLKQIDTTGVEPMAHALPVKNVPPPRHPRARLAAR